MIERFSKKEKKDKNIEKNGKFTIESFSFNFLKCWNRQLYRESLIFLYLQSKYKFRNNSSYQ